LKRFGRTDSLLSTVFIVLVSILAYGQGPLPADPSDAPVIETQKKDQASKPKKAVTVGHNGLVFSTKDESSKLRVHGYLQGDARLFSSDLKNQSPDVLLFRRIRPLFEGTLFNTLDYRFMPDFGQNNPQIQEVYVELKSASVARLRVGKFKTPLGLENLRSDREMTFVERSLVSNLLPLREVGTQIGGSVLAKSLSYTIGYFNGTVDGSNGNFNWRTSNEGVARIFAQPFLTSNIAPIQQIGIGLAGSFGSEHGALPSFKTVGQNKFFKYSSTAFADGGHERISPQAWYYFGPVGILGEYSISAQNIYNKGITRRLSNQAWEVASSVVITGEKNSYAGIRPNRAFEPYKGLRHLGAWELATRYTRLGVDPKAFPIFANPKTSASSANEYAIGVNWYLNRYIKLVNDYEYTRLGRNTATTTPLHNENVIMSCIQFAF
jgi:phosphate-selective porin OprO and OprP